MPAPAAVSHRYTGDEMTTYDLAESIAEGLAQRTDIDDMQAPEDASEGDAPTTFFLNIDGDSFEVSVTKL